MYLSPLFFASIGIKVSLPGMSGSIIWFTLILVLVAMITKIIGCGLGAKLCGYKNYQCVRIGVGMISRGEVALIVANKGMALGLMGSNFLGPVVVVVIMTTIVTPILLKIVFKRFAPPVASLAPVVSEEQISDEESMAGRYEERERYHTGEEFK